MASSARVRRKKIHKQTSHLTRHTSLLLARAHSTHARMDAAAPTLRERSTGGTSDDPPTRKPPQPPPPPHSQRRRRAVPSASDETAGRLRRFLYSLALGAAVAAAFEVTGRRYGVVSSLANSPAPGSSPPPAQPELLDAPTPPTDAFDTWVYQRDTRKVAFLFVLTKGENGLPHDHLWARFYAGQDPNLYAIHIHVPKAFVFNASTTAAPELFKDTEVRSVVEEKTRSGKYLLIIVWAIRVTSCFVYRGLALVGHQSLTPPRAARRGRRPVRHHQRRVRAGPDLPGSARVPARRRAGPGELISIIVRVGN